MSSKPKLVIVFFLFINISMAQTMRYFGSLLHHTSPTNDYRCANGALHSINENCNTCFFESGVSKYILLNSECVIEPSLCVNELKTEVGGKCLDIAGHPNCDLEINPNPGAKTNTLSIFEDGCSISGQIKLSDPINNQGRAKLNFSAQIIGFTETSPGKCMDKTMKFRAKIKLHPSQGNYPQVIYEREIAYNNLNTLIPMNQISVGKPFYGTNNLEIFSVGNEPSKIILEYEVFKGSTSLSKDYAPPVDIGIRYNDKLGKCPINDTTNPNFYCQNNGLVAGRCNLACKRGYYNSGNLCLKCVGNSSEPDTCQRYVNNQSIIN